MALRSLINTITTPFSSRSPSANGSSSDSAVAAAAAAAATTLFPTVDPAVDGPECLEDCSNCTIAYPRKFKVEEDDQLYGKIKGWATHVLVATGKTDWVRDVEDEPGSVMKAFGKASIEPSNGRMMLSASNIPLPSYNADAPEGQRPTSIMLLPAFSIIDNVRPDDVDELTERFINPGPSSTSPLPPLPSRPTPPTSSVPAPTLPSPPSSTSPEDKPSSTILSNDNKTHYISPTISASPASQMRARPCPHRYLILLCSQRTRDARCGISAPLLRRELERHLRPLGLYRDLDDERPGGVGIYFISHVGGHKYSANMLIYRRQLFSSPSAASDSAKISHDTTLNDKPQQDVCGEAAQAIWLARVRPEDCEGIVKYTVLQGKVVKPQRQLRGGWDRERGAVSW
ncbi:MAG: hypothetical protein M1825_002539 [Sarcosagium campestre]|nr:MAG: hypothetical protein M1825_002539 [Sarcosagium campestre]